MLVNILFILVSIIVLVLIALWLRAAIIIFCTSFIGSYACIRGISFFAGNFPSEFTIIDIISAGEEEQLNEMLNLDVYIYIGLIIVLAIIGIIAQFKINENDKYNDEIDSDMIER